MASVLSSCLPLACPSSPTTPAYVPLPFSSPILEQSLPVLEGEDDNFSFTATYLEPEQLGLLTSPDSRLGSPGQAVQVLHLTNVCLLALVPQATPSPGSTNLSSPELRLELSTSSDAEEQAGCKRVRSEESPLVEENKSTSPKTQILRNFGT